MKMEPYKLNQKVVLGNIVSTLDPKTGTQRPVFTPIKTLWYAPQKRTLAQQYQIIGTSLDNTIVIVTRHQSNDYTGYKMQIKGANYSIQSISPDDSNEYLTYDYWTLKKDK